MAREQSHNDQIQKLDDALRADQGGLYTQSLTEQGNALRGWYARLLSSLALLTGEADIVYAQGDVYELDHSARVVLYTEQMLVIAEISDTRSDDEGPLPLAYPRAAITSLAVAATERSDAKSYVWPGDLYVRVGYDGLDQDLELHGAAYNRWAPNERGDIWKLLDALRSDLARV